MAIMLLQLRLFSLALLLFGILQLSGACNNGDTVWQAWSPCTRSCGGGTQHRHGDSCFWGIDDDEDRNCNEFCRHGHHYYNDRCHCPSWRTGTCCENCRHIYIANCIGDNKECGGNPDNIRCTKCYDPYYSGGYGAGCLLCPRITNCINNKHHCTSPYDTKCLKCESDNIFYKRTRSGKQCERMCSFDTHSCWPGTCQDELTTSCKCAPGFYPVQNGTHTICQLEEDNTPSILNCQTEIRGTNGDATQTGAGQCQDLPDLYGNFLPTLLSFTMMSEFTINVTAWVPRPKYIHEENFGITDTSVSTKLVTIQGKKDPETIDKFILKKDQRNGQEAKSTVENKNSYTLSDTRYNLTNGQRLCIEFEALGGGFLVTKDFDANTLQIPIPYKKTNAEETICYTFDDVKPRHCLEDKACPYTEPLNVFNRITRSPEIELLFDGWNDPIPLGGNSSHASGIDLYEINVYEVSNGTVSMQNTAYSKILNSSTITKYIKFTLQSSNPKLYCVILGVKDVANNVQYSRRFFLFDNSSYISVDDGKSLKVTSASSDMKFKWQTHHNNICIDWKNYFYNKLYLDNPFLGRINPDSNGQIYGIYEQEDGILPVKGTENIFGITQFYFAYSLDNGPISSEKLVPNFQTQSYCETLAFKDGQTYTLYIKAIDVMNNSYIENRTVHIDRTAPHINNVGLMKNGLRSLFVHNDIDLSKMNLSFDALDPHSGILNIDWTFGILDSGVILGSQKNGPVHIDKESCTKTLEKCYCPQIGNCEIFAYNIPLNKLVKNNTNIGNHNRNYFFTVKVTNNAGLSNIEHMDILVDNSPPEKGVVYEGPVGTPDIDYTSDTSFVIRWHGFIDHESGIKEYRIKLSDTCVTKEKLLTNDGHQNISEYIKVPYTESTTRINAHFTGKKYVNIIAINNAMDASEVACSDGITRDDTPPDVQNVRLQHGKWSESLFCTRGYAWHFKSDLKKMILPNTTLCNQRCKEDSTGVDIFNVLPIKKRYNDDTNVSEYLCKHLPMYDTDNVIYLPTDHIEISWDIKENGSQIEDYYVGLGLKSGNMTSASIVDYKSTNGKRNFKIGHTGVGSGILFYAHIKAVNKAKTETITVLGPILIDETPPIFNTKPTIRLGTHLITIGWDKSTVYDPEQSDQVNQIFFQIDCDTNVVSPFLEWRLEDKKSCSNFSGGCITYPLERLKKMDTDSGLNFTIKVFAYNNAGHFATEVTEPFRIPSRYPPGYAIVKDVDPFGPTRTHIRDVDVHFTANKLCTEWNGFAHHEHVAIEIGVGTNNMAANVIPYQATNGSNVACIQSRAIVFNIKYFILLRASCSGGETISSSNGVTILNETNLTENFKICIGTDSFNTEWIQQLPQNSSQVNFCASRNLQLGQRSTLIINGVNRNTSVKENQYIFIDGIEYFNSSMKVETVIVSVAEKPCVTIDNEAFRNISVEMYHNSDDCKRFIKEISTFPVSWKSHENTSILRHLRYEIALSKLSDALQNTHTYKVITDWTNADRNSSHVIHTHSLSQSIEYAILIKICTSNRCIGQIVSKKFKIEQSIEAGRIRSFNLELSNKISCIGINLEWEMFRAKSNISVYQWSISKDKEANDVLAKWRTVSNNGDSVYKVSMCIQVPVLRHSTLYLCVRAFSTAGNTKTICQTASVVVEAEFDTNTLYDIDSSLPSWKIIKEMLHSSNIGTNYAVLHNSEMDFGNTNTSVVGIIMYATERRVNWFLMKHKHVPDFNQCEKDSDCVFTTQTQNGFVLFDNKVIEKNTFYYTCAYSNASSVSRELFTEIFSEIRVCSNGFIIDDTPPFGGHVTVLHSGGFITRRGELNIYWSGFDDNVDTTQLGYVDRIKFYSCAVGTRPGSEDIVQYIDVGNTQHAVIRNFTVVDGNVIYASVKATDHAGLSRVIYSNEMTVDSSPPVSGKISINADSEYISSKSIEICLTGFSDYQSGIEYFEVAFGSDEYLEDVQTGSKFLSDNIEVDLPENMHDGHKYFIKAKATNRAGLSSTSVSMVIIPDRSAPTGGIVTDGDGDRLFYKDQDFQKELGYIQGHWKGFNDPHSGVNFYRVGLGTKRYQDDVEGMMDVGLHTDIIWNGTYEVGKKYFLTVEACNGAKLCQSVSSDGILLDNSPPIHGIVKVGNGIQHQKYVPTGESVHIRWVGYEDPQSGIDHYEYCLGTKPLLCDALSFQPCLLESSIIKTGLNLTHGNSYYASVKAFNRVGLSVTTVSDSFTIDNTPPVIIEKPTFNTDGMAGLEAQWDRSVLKITWKFIDDESKIAFHIITLKTHHEGHTPVEHMHLGNVDSLTIGLNETNWLHNGDKYFVLITSCNSAELCTTSQSENLLIDSSPPHQGGFKPPMTWRNFIDASSHARSKIMITWYGFVDAESAIDTYYLTVSRSYSGDELSGGTIARHAKNDLDEKNTTIVLSDSLREDESLIITIWARNKAGLNSSVERITVSVLVSNKGISKNMSGVLEIQKHSCDIHYCNKDCTCAVLGSPCVDVQINQKCTNLNKTDVISFNYPEIDVFGGLNSNRRDITESSACLSAHWIPQGDDSMIQRFEWSMGIMNEPVGVGILDLKSETPWKDVGKQVETVYCVSTSSGLQHDTDYQVYVRAWYTWNTFAVFVSPPIRIEHTPPHHAKGKNIKDSDGTCLFDFDVIDWMDSMTACWDKVFADSQGKIIYYTVSLGTTINGSDIYEVKNVGLATNITVSNLKLSHGTHYYFTVTAYNSVGLHTTLCSDGFLIDMDTPVTGVVFNTDNHLDSVFQSSKTSFGISWHGFVDRQSGVQSYFVAVVDNSVTNYTNVTFLDVKLKNKHVFHDIDLQHGKLYKGLVKAVDKAGHSTDAVSSKPKLIDETAPRSFECDQYQNQRILLHEKIPSTNGTISFSGNMSSNRNYILKGILTGSSRSIKPILSFGRTLIKLPVTINNNNTVEFQHDFISNYFGIVLFEISGLEALSSETNFSIDIKLSKCILDKRGNGKGLTVRQIGSSKLLVDIKIVDEDSSLYKVQLGLGTSPGGFQIKPLTVVHVDSSRYIDVDVQNGANIYGTVLAENHAGLKSVFKSAPITMDKTPPLISQIQHKLTANSLKVSQSNTTFRLQVKWDVTDKESGVKYCLCRIGKHLDMEYDEGYRLSDTSETCLFNGLNLQHGDLIFVHIKCINNVELATEKVSKTIPVSIDAPDSSLAAVYFISTDKSIHDGYRGNNNTTAISGNIPFIQTDRSRLKFEWIGFEDMTGIDYYEYRLVCQNDTILDWKRNGKHTVAELNGVDLHSGMMYIAEVRAINYGLHASNPVISHVVVHNEEPKLTGKPLSVTRRNQFVLFDWNDVFRLVDEISVTYDVTVGTKSGYSDILELKSTKLNKYKVIVPQSTIIAPDIRELFISVRCLYSTGLFTFYQYNYKL